MDIWVSFRYFQCECGGTIKKPLGTFQNGIKQQNYFLPQKVHGVLKKFLLKIKTDTFTDLKGPPTASFDFYQELFWNTL